MRPQPRVNSQVKFLQQRRKGIPGICGRAMMNSMTCFLRIVFPLCMLFAVLPLIGCLPTQLGPASDGTALLRKRVTHTGRGTWFYVRSCIDSVAC